MKSHLRRSLSLSLAFFLALPAGAAAPQPAADANAAITINVDAAASRHAIDPRIYGVAGATTQALAELGVTVNRWGGNASSRHNWAISTTNRCKDYYFENVPDDVSSGDGSNGKAVDDFIAPSMTAGAAPLITIPVMGLLPKDRQYRCGFSIAKYGPQQDADYQWRPDCGNGKRADDTRMRFVNDPADTSSVFPASHQGNWVQHLVDTWGSAANGGVRYYALDNEPSLWSFDHWDVHPSGSTYDEVWGKMAEYGAVIKAKDPNALISGVEEWGWGGYFSSGLDQENNNSADRNAHGGVYFAPWLLQQAKTYEQQHGTRILDIFALHYYPQGDQTFTHFEFSDDTSTTTQLLRNRSTRSLWDPAYVDQSWIGTTGIDGGKVRLIPRMKEWVSTYYPGTLTAITEYNWGAEDHINGGTAQADILGIFGREGLDMAVRWVSPKDGSPAFNAFKMYRNYDGAHHGFGETSVSATVPNPDEVSAFAAQRTSDNALTIMIVAKVLSGTTPVTVNLANFAASGPAKRWQLTSTNAITPVADVPVNSSALTLSVPAQSITLLVVPTSASLAAPAGVTATATSTSTATVSWSAVAGATGYEVWRSFNNGAYSLGGTSASTTLNDAGLAANTTYLYKVKATAGVASSPFSAIDPATTTVFTDASLSGTSVKAVHFTELRTAVNAMRASAGLAAQVFTDPTLSGAIGVKAVHLTQLRTALDQARSTLGLSAIGYADPTITVNSTTVKAAHVTELRNGVK